MLVYIFVHRAGTRTRQEHERLTYISCGTSDIYTERSITEYGRLRIEFRRRRRLVRIGRQAQEKSSHIGRHDRPYHQDETETYRPQGIVGAGHERRARLAFDGGIHLPLHKRGGCGFFDLSARYRQTAEVGVLSAFYMVYGHDGRGGGRRMDRERRR